MELDKKLKVPTCTKCRNHDIFNVPLKGHGKYCPFRECNCWKCKLIEERHKTNKRKRELNEAEVEATSNVSKGKENEKKSPTSKEGNNHCDKPTSDSATIVGTTKALDTCSDTDEQPSIKKQSVEEKPKATKKKRSYSRPTKQCRNKRTFIAPGLQPTSYHIQTHPCVGKPLGSCVRSSLPNTSYAYPFKAAGTTPKSGTLTTMSHDSLPCSHYQGAPYRYQQTVAHMDSSQATTPPSLLMHGEVVPMEHSYEALDNLYWYLSPPNVCVIPRPSPLPRPVPIVRPCYQELCSQIKKV